MAEKKADILAGNAISDLGGTACGKISIAGQPGYYCSPQIIVGRAYRRFR
jgi:hypothetical protein